MPWFPHIHTPIYTVASVVCCVNEQHAVVQGTDQAKEVIPFRHALVGYGVQDTLQSPMDGDPASHVEVCV
jgi:hypothetical protein